MLFYVEMGVQFTKTYGDINEPFYDSMEAMYERAAKFVTKHNLQKQFAFRFEHLLHETAEMGWGFHDYLTQVYYEHFDHAEAGSQHSK